MLLSVGMSEKFKKSCLNLQKNFQKEIHLYQQHIPILNTKFTDIFPLILASGSPRRKELLKNIGLKIRVIPSQVNEDNIPGTPEEKACHWALMKTEAVARQEKGVILGADTIVVFNDHIFGKPQNKNEAKKMLSQLSGNSHTVITGLVLINTQNTRQIIKSIKSTVTFRTIREEEIANYILTKEPMDKAGSYAIQGKGAAFVKKVEGCYTNIIGLPLTTCINALVEIISP